MEFKNPSLALATLAASAGMLLTIKSPLFPVAALLGTSTGGLLAASCPGSPSRRERKIQEWQANLDSWQKVLDERESELEPQCRELFERVKCQALEAAKVEFAPQFEQSQSHIDQQLQLLEELKLKAQEKCDAIAERERALKEMAQAAQSSEHQLREEIEQYQKDAEQRITSIEQYYRNTYGAIAGQFANENKLLKQPDHTDGSCNEELLADRAIDVLGAHGIVVKEPRVKPTSKGFKLSFKVLPRLLKKGGSKEGDATEQLLSVGDALKIISNQLLDTLKASIPGCCTKPGVEAIYGGVELTFDTSGIDHDERERIATKSADIEEPPTNWFETAVNECAHIRVTGQRDSGKSTLVSNIVDLKLAQNPGCQIKLCNPLYGSKKDRWNIPATWKSFDESLEGLTELSDLIYQRNRNGREAKDAGLATPEFEPILYIFDEIDTTVSVHGKEASELLKSCLTKGTHYDVHVIYLGQSPLCSTLKLNRPDFNHTTNFHMGQNIGRAINDSDNIAQSAKTALERQNQLRQERGDNFILYCDYGKTQFLAFPPAPDSFRNPNDQMVGMADNSSDPVTNSVEVVEVRGMLESLWNKECSEVPPEMVEKTLDGGNPPKTAKNPEIETSSPPPTKVKCPKCESLKTRKNGKRNGRQRYQCCSCNKTFSEI